jgi:hypothetical protein
LAAPAVWSAATRDIPGYDPSYTYDVTAHVRLARLYGIGRPLRKSLDRLTPAWEDSWALSLLLERESLAMLAGSIALVLLAFTARSLLRRYGESRLRIRTVRLTDRISQAVVLSFSQAPHPGSRGAGHLDAGPHAPPAEAEPAAVSKAN